MAKKLILTGICIAITLILSNYAFAADSDDDEIKVRRLEMVNETATVRVNQERTLLVEVVPRDADNQDIEWNSSNSEVVMVEGDGVIIGISPGTAEITAASHNGRTATCTVTVPSAVITELEQQVKNADIPSADVNSGKTLSASALRLQVENAAKDNPKEKTVTLTYSDKTTVSSAALRSAAFTATYSSVDAVLRFRTLDEDGNIQGQLTIRPENAGDADRKISLGVYTNGKQLTTVRQKAAAYFNEPVAVVRLTQTEGFEVPVEVAAKVDLTGIDTQAIDIFRYANGAYIKLDHPELRVDNNGFLHFTVSEGGAYIIVSQ